MSVWSVELSNPGDATGTLQRIARSPQCYFLDPGTGPGSPNATNVVLVFVVLLAVVVVMRFSIC